MPQLEDAHLLWSPWLSSCFQKIKPESGPNTMLLSVTMSPRRPVCDFHLILIENIQKEIYETPNTNKCGKTSFSPTYLLLKQILHRLNL